MGNKIPKLLLEFTRNYNGYLVLNGNQDEYENIKLGRIALDWKPQKDYTKRGSKYDIITKEELTEIHHTFRLDEKVPNPLISLVFSAILISPLLFLFIFVYCIFNSL